MMFFSKFNYKTSTFTIWATNGKQWSAREFSTKVEADAEAASLNQHFFGGR